jgi:multiple sugar transport system permease protein
MLGFFVFSFGALLAGLGLSFFRYDFFTKPVFTGVANFSALVGDERMGIVFANTAIFWVGMFVLDLVVALLVASALNSRIPDGVSVLYRGIFFFPVLLSGAVMASVWRYLLNTDMGVVNWYLQSFGMDKIPWLVSSAWVRQAIIIATVWNGVGFNTVLILAGLRNIPSFLYESAEIDGAGPLSKFYFVTLPLLTPTLFFIMVKGLIGVFQLFDEPYMLTGGGPGDASRTVVMYIYELGFKTLRLGNASSVAMVLFVVIAAATATQLAASRRWVFYR